MKSYRNIKKTVLVLILLFMGIVVGIHRDEFYVEKEYSASNSMSKDENGEALEPGEIALDGSVEVRQEFIARESELTKVMIDFKAWEQKNGKGTIQIEVQDQAGEVLASAEKPVSNLVQSKMSTTTAFSIPADLNKGETYVLVIRSNQVESAKGVFLYEMEKKGAVFGNLTVNGEMASGRIRLKFGMIHFSDKSMKMMYLVIGFGVLFVLIPFDRLRIRRKDGSTLVELNNWMARILFIAAVPMAFFIVQRYSGFDISDFLRLSLKLKGLTNYLLYGLIWWLLYLICNRTKYTAVLLVGLSSVLGLANYFVWEFRGIPVMAADLMSFGTAMDVAGHYTYELNLSALWALVYTVVFLCAVLSLKSYRGLRWRYRLCALAGFFLPYGVFYTQLLHGTLMKDHGITVSVWEPSRNYAKNGSLLSFFLSYTYYVVDKPSQYSAAKAEELTKEYVSDSLSEETEGVKPNIIAIMNEAWSDLDVDGDLETSEDFMPYVHGLEENTVKGELYVSVFAGNTANTEFEFLTGCSMAFLPFRSIPYDTYIKEALPSLTYNLRADGYGGNYAVHPYSATAWNRDEAYPLLGFEKFYSVKDFENITYLRNFASDKTDFDFIISKYEEWRKQSEQPFYTFSVTVQNHGGYSASQGLVDTSIKITNEEQANESAEQYINLIKTTDVAFEELLSYFEKVEDPTVIVMFGDHQPSLPGSFYESLFGKNSDDYTLEDTKKKYTVPYVIWANYDIQEGEANMSANYLSAYLMKVIGGKMTGYQKYLMDLYEEVPMITANGYCGADGVLHELGEKSAYSDAIEEYQILQYNNLFDEGKRVEEFYTLAG